jgi:hypothetical protein
MGLLVDEFLEDFEYPACRAALILVSSILVASGCFYFAHLCSRAENRGGPAD